MFSLGLGCEGLNLGLLLLDFSLLKLPMLKHLDLVLVCLGDPGCNSSDLAKDLRSLWPVGWGITQTLADQPHQRVVLADISEVFCSTIKFQNWKHHHWILRVGAKGIGWKWPPATEHMDDHDTIGIAVDFGGVGWSGHEGLWGHVAGGAGCLCGHPLCHLGRGDVEDLCYPKVRNLSTHAGCQEHVVGRQVSVYDGW